MTIQIEALYEYAKHNDLIPDLFFKTSQTDLVVDLTARGLYRGVVEEKVTLTVPRINEMRTGKAGSDPKKPKARMLDNIEYTFGPNRKHLLLLLDQLHRATGESKIKAILNFLSGEIPKELVEKLDGDQKRVVAFRVAKQWPYDGPELRAHIQAPVEPTGLCRITGLPCVPLNLHPDIYRMPGQYMSTLISFNTPTSQFEGKSQGCNYPVSPEVGYGYTNALNTFLSWDDRRYYHSAVNIFNKTVIVFWTLSDLGVTPVLEAFDPRVNVEDPNNKKEVALAYRALNDATDLELKRWQQEGLEDIVYALALTTTKKRLAIVDWHQIPAHKLASNLLRFRSETGRRSVRSMISALNKHNKKEKPFNVEVARTVIKGSCWPRPIQNRALNHNPTREWIHTLNLRGTL